MALPSPSSSSSFAAPVSSLPASYQADSRMYFSGEARCCYEENQIEMNKKEEDAKSLLSHRVFDRQIRLWGVEAQRRSVCFSLSF